MANLKEIRNRIASIKNTRQVTSAMKMVSAAKLKKAQDSILSVSPYEKKLQSIIQNLSLSDTKFESIFFKEPKVENVLIVVVGSNKGLCGAFNANIVKIAVQHTLDNHKLQLTEGVVKFHVLGHQVEKALKSKNVIFQGSSNYILDNIGYEPISKLGNELMELFALGTFQRIDIVYNKFKNAANQLLTVEQFLPVIKPEISNKELVTSDYIFEPTKEEILSSIIPESLRMKLFRIVLDSNAAEHGARMTAMHMATDNATELINNLQKSYNNARQSAITNEILEITAGAEALKG